MAVRTADRLAKDEEEIDEVACARLLSVCEALKAHDVRVSSQFDWCGFFARARSSSRRMGVSRVYTSTTTTLLRLRGGPPEHLHDGPDLVVAEVNLADVGEKYLSAETALPADTSVRTVIAPGELVPASAVAPMAASSCPAPWSPTGWICPAPEASAPTASPIQSVALAPSSRGPSSMAERG